MKEAPYLIYGTAWKGHRTTELVETALRLGFRAIDTANQPKHYQERLVGNALSSLAEQGIPRDTLYLQTKFTSVQGQDQRLPYDPHAKIKVQVEQSFASSLQNLQTDYIDSYLLHGPDSYPDLGVQDWEVWSAMTELHVSGRVKALGISNVNARQLMSLCKKAPVKPAIVQNRCYANKGWDREVRAVCRSEGIIYQGFSLLTANPLVIMHPQVESLADKIQRTPQQIIYRFAIQMGIIPLTGTTNDSHMKEALQVCDFQLREADVSAIQDLGG